MNKIFGVVSLAVPLALLASPVLAQAGGIPCAKRSAVLETLAAKYGEMPISRGLSSDGAIVEILVSSKGSWSMLVSMPDGNSCLAGVGEMWEDLQVSHREQAQAPEHPVSYFPPR